MQLNSFQFYWKLFALLLITAVVYYPALDSRFLLDDFYNLSELEKVGDKGYLYFIFSGFSGPSGRPVSLFSFALQHQHWLVEPAAFKALNLFIHLCNGVLIFMISRCLYQAIPQCKKYKDNLALLCTAVWLLHPMQISTVLYVVQRMTLLSAFFSLLAVWSYILFRNKNDFSIFGRSSIIFSIFYGLLCVLAVFSKENGILIPVYILAIEYTLFHNKLRTSTWKVWSSIFIYSPLILLTVYLASSFDSLLLQYQFREYGPLERLMTEAKIVFTYLSNLVFPHPAAFSLYHDDVQAVTGLFKPVSTFFYVVGIIFISLFCIIHRIKFLVIAFSVFWFFGGHLLESTYLNLELYFEHRNYMPSFGVFFFLIWLSFICWNRLRKYSFFLIPIISLFYLSVLLVTLLELNLWSKPIEQVIEWQRRSPKSARAIEDLGIMYAKSGDYPNAINTYHKISEIYPNEIYPYLREASIISCYKQESISMDKWEEMLSIAKKAEWYGFATIAELDAITFNIRKGECKTLNIFMLIRVIVTLVNNPEYKNFRAPLHELAAYLNAYIGESDAAINNISQAVKLRENAARHISKIRILLSFNKMDEVEVSLREFEAFLKRKPRAYVAYKGSYEELEQFFNDYKNKPESKLLD